MQHLLGDTWVICKLLALVNTHVLVAAPQLVGARILPLVCFMLIDKSGDTKATRVVITIRTSF